jgi:purine nucleoside phosphorylase
MAQLTVETILLLDSFGGLNAHVQTGDQVLVSAEQLGSFTAVLDKNLLFYDPVDYPGLKMTMLTLSKL